MMNNMRTQFFFATISCFRINSVFSIFTPKQGNLNPLLIISSSTFHNSNQPRLKRQDLSYAFECITNIDDALSLFRYMLQMKPTPSAYHYTNLFLSVVKIEHDSHVVKMEHYSQVILMFKKMRLLGCPVNEYTMNIVVNCYAQLREVYLSFAVIGAFLKRGYTPDFVTFTCLIKGLFLRGEVGKAVDLFKNLIKGNLYKVNEYTIATVLNGLVKSGKVVDAAVLLHIAEKNNWKLDVVCYTTVIDGLCKGGMLRDGMELLFRMIDKGILPNVVTYTSFIQSLFINKKIDLALGIFNDLPSRGIYPNAITFTVIIQGLCNEGLFQDVKEMLENMEGVGLSPDDVAYNVIIRSCLRLHNRNNFHSINLLRHIVGRDFQLQASTFFLLLGRLQVMRQMHYFYDDHVIKHLIQKVTTSCPLHQMRDSNDEFMVSSLSQKFIEM